MAYPNHHNGRDELEFMRDLWESLQAFDRYHRRRILNYVDAHHSRLSDEEHQQENPEPEFEPDRRSPFQGGM